MICFANHSPEKIRSREFCQSDLTLDSCRTMDGRSSPTFADQGELEIGQQGDEGQIKAKVLSIRFEMR
jgi:hypothetical protein